MYYLPFDRLMGLWIINEFLKEHINITSTTFSIHNDKFEKKLLFMDKSLMRIGDALSISKFYSCMNILSEDTKTLEL